MKNGLDLYKRIGNRETYQQRWNDLPDKERAKTNFQDWKQEQNKENIIAQGFGVNSMMETSYKKGLNKNNSRLWVKDSSDFNSEWRIFKK